MNDTISDNAAGLVNLMAWTGTVDKIDLLARCLTRTGRKVTTRTVEAVLADMQDEWDAGGTH